MRNLPIKIYYSIEDNYPPFRVDVVELFTQELTNLGVDIEWYMRRVNAGNYVKEQFCGQTVHLAYKPAGKHKLAKVLTKFSFWLTNIAALINQLNKPVQIVQVRDQYIAAIAAITVAKIKKVPFVYWCSYPFPEHYLALAQLSTGFKRLYYFSHGWLGKLLLYRVIMPLSTHIFVQSTRMQQDIAQHGINESKMTAVPMGVPKRLLDWAKSHPADIVAGRIVYTGIMTPERHLDMIIDAFALTKAQCANATLLMVGDGVHPSERAALEAQVTRLGLSSSVQFTGFVPIEQAWAYAASAAVCLSPVHPSPVLDCASPTKLYEYMALARPVVCNYHPEQTAVINASGAGLCVPWQAQAFSDAIVSLLNNPQQTELNAQNGPAWVAANRAYPIIAQTVFKQYQQLLSPIT